MAIEIIARSGAAKHFANLLIAWYERNKRDLPWRNTRNPFHILLSEVILQQTRVQQGLPYYHAFVETFPTIQDLAMADEPTVLRLWQGLGYYSRARNLHATAKQVVELYGGQLPDEYEELIKLKGIGKYTASAIASFAFHKKHAVVDGNVYRVLSRVFGIEEDIASGSGVKLFQQVAEGLLPIKQHEIYNQAIMEFGAMACVPKNPLCENCVLQQGCFAFAHNMQSKLPVKIKKLLKRNRYLNYVVLMHNDEMLVRERVAGDIWQGLNEFMLLEGDVHLGQEEVLKALVAMGWKIKTLVKETVVYKHVLTHQNLYAKFFVMELRTRPSADLLGDMKWVNKEELMQIPKSVLISRFLEQDFFN